MTRETPSPNYGQPINPFASPQSLEGPAMETLPGGEVSHPGILDAMSATRPWVMFLGIVGFIVGGLCLLGGGGMALGSGFSRRGDSGPMVAVGLVYFLVAFVQFAAAYYLVTYARRIGDFLTSRQNQPLAEALKAQKSFWRLVGIITIIYLILVAIAIGVSVIAAMAAMNRSTFH